MSSLCLMRESEHQVCFHTSPVKEKIPATVRAMVPPKPSYGGTLSGKIRSGHGHSVRRLQPTSAGKSSTASATARDLRSGIDSMDPDLNVIANEVNRYAVGCAIRFRLAHRKTGVYNPRRGRLLTYNRIGLMISADADPYGRLGSMCHGLLTLASPQSSHALMIRYAEQSS